MPGLDDLLALAERAPMALKLGRALRAARAGDPTALGYLLTDGWKDACSLHSPELRAAVEIAVPRVLETWTLARQALRGEVVEGEATPIEPWRDLRRHVQAQTYGAHVLVGPPGSGKTSLGFKLAWGWRQRLGYRVEVVAAYPEDIPSWATPISMRTLLYRARKLARYVDPGLSAEEAAEETARRAAAAATGRRATEMVVEPPVSRADIRRISRRIIVIDEGTLSLGRLGGVSQQNAREAAAIMMMHCRHISSIIVVIGQLLRHIPEQMRSQATLWFKRPRGNEPGNDQSYHTWVKRTWAEVMDAWEERFPREIRAAGWDADFPDERCWAYTISETLGGHGYHGFCPFTPLTGAQFAGLIDGQEPECEDEEDDDGASA